MALHDEAVDALASRFGDAVATAARDAMEQLLELIRSGVAPRDAVERVQAGFSSRYVDQLAAAFSELLQRSVGSAAIREMSVGEVPLSRRLYEHDRQVSADVAALVREHAQGVHQARALALKLYDGYSPRSPERPAPLEGNARAELPRALRALTQDRITRAELGRLLEEGRRRATGLKTSALRVAYTEALDAWADGAAPQALKRRLDVAYREKNRFFANRIAQTELARAHQGAVAAELLQDVTIEVVQVKLNPMHPVTDICDLHGRADLFGLGPGTYPKAHAPVPPFHPFCWCKLRPRPSLSASGAREVPGGVAAYLRGLGPGQAAQVMGSLERAQRVLDGALLDDVVNEGRAAAYRLQRLGNFRAPSVVAPVDPQLPPVPAVPPTPVVATRPQTLDGYLAAGKEIVDKLPVFAEGAQAWHETLMARLREAGRLGGQARVASDGAAATLVRQASALFPAAWNAVSDRLGPLYARSLGLKGRAFQVTMDTDRWVVQLPAFGLQRNVAAGTGFIAVRAGDVAVAVHEYAHRLQAAMPKLDRLFQELHRRRVAGQKVKRIRDVGAAYAHYNPRELTREDSYTDAYQGREYHVAAGGVALDGGAKEVLSMAMEAVVGGMSARPSSPRLQSEERLRRMFALDREMVDLVVGVLFHFNP